MTDPDLPDTASTELLFSPGERLLWWAGQVIPLGSRATSLVACLFEREGQVVEAGALLAAGWPGRAVAANNLSVQIAGLRRALADAGADPHRIRTVPGRGYMLVASHAPPPPMAAQPFIGRTDALHALDRALARHRLVTVTGAGGIGKTRLAVEACAAAGPRFDGGWRLVELAALPPGAVAGGAIASALGDLQPTEAALAGWLRHRQLLLLLDNAEHVSVPLAGLLDRLLAACPGLAVLATSRQRLGAASEHIFHLHPFALPSPVARPSASDAMQSEAVAFLAQRAADTLPGFAVTDGNAAAVMDIVRRLGGNALAIEIILPALAVQAPEELAVRLDARFQLGAAAGPGIPPRQHTLRTVLDWSWSLLDDAEREMMQRCAVLSTAHGLDTLVALAPDPAAEPPARLLTALAGLVDKSMLTAVRDGGSTRYRMLQTTRDYTLDQLGADEPALRRRHARWMAARLEQAQAEWPRTDGRAWLKRHGGMADDLRAALRHAFSPEGDPALAIHLVAASGTLWWELPGPPLGEMHGWFVQAAALPELAAQPHAVQAWLWLGYSWRDAVLGDADNRPAAQRAVEAARRAGDQIALGAALLRHGTTLVRAETIEQAGTVLAEAEQVLRRHAPGKWLALVLGRRADVLVRQDDALGAMPLYREAIDLVRALHYRHGMVTTISNMAEVLFTQNMTAQAMLQLALLREAVPAGPRSAAMATFAAHLTLDGRTAEAVGLVEEVADWAPATGMTAPLAWAAETLALILARSGRLAQAAPLAGFARRVLPSKATRYGSRKAVVEQLDGLIAAMAGGERDVLMQAGASWDGMDAVDAVRIACRTATA